METIPFTEFRKKASRFLSLVELGETVYISRHGHIIAEITPPKNKKYQEPAWKKPGLKLFVKGASLSKAILQEREHE